MDSASNQSNRSDLISFEIAGQEYCIDIRAVREIRGWSQPTPMPNAPPYVLGVINLRGMVIPVLDLGSRLGLGETIHTSRRVYVVVEHDDRLVGLMVDAVQETLSVDASLLQPPPVLDYGAEGSLVDAMLPMEGRMLARLVLSALLPTESALSAPEPALAA